MSGLLIHLALLASPFSHESVPKYPPDVIVERPDTRADRHNCPVPLPLKTERFILLGFGDGAAVSDVSVAGLDVVTTSGEVVLREGFHNVFLVLASSRPMIFRLSGRVDRLSRVVVLNRQGAGSPELNPEMSRLASERTVTSVRQKLTSGPRKQSPTFSVGSLTAEAPCTDSTSGSYTVSALASASSHLTPLIIPERLSSRTLILIIQGEWRK